MEAVAAVLSPFLVGISLESIRFPESEDTLRLLRSLTDASLSRPWPPRNARLAGSCGTHDICAGDGRRREQLVLTRTLPLQNFALRGVDDTQVRCFSPLFVARKLGLLFPSAAAAECPRNTMC